jgi:hypothetical protein
VEGSIVSRIDVQVLEGRPVRIACGKGHLELDGVSPTPQPTPCATNLVLGVRSSSQEPIEFQFEPSSRFGEIHVRAQAGSVLRIRGNLQAEREISVTASSVQVAAQLNAARVHVEATREVELTENGTIVCPSGSVILTSRRGGTLELRGTVSVGREDAGRGGTIFGFAPNIRIERSARLDASGADRGGQIIIGGIPGSSPSSSSSNVFVSEGAILSANAFEEGNGGSVLLWSTDETAFHGLASAQGGRRGGDGGLVDVSSRGTLGAYGEIDVAAPFGKPGRVLFDPFYVIVLPRSAYFTPSILLGLPPGTVQSMVGVYDADWFLSKSDPPLLTNTGLFVLEHALRFIDFVTEFIAAHGLPVSTTDLFEQAIESIDPDIQALEGLRVQYHSGNLLISLSAKIAGYVLPPLKLVKLLGYVHYVSANALEPLKGDISVSALNGIFLLTGIVGPIELEDDHGLLDPDLNLVKQRPEATTTFRTLGPIVSLGGIRYGGAKLELHAGAPIDNDAVNSMTGILAGLTPIPFLDIAVTSDLVRDYIQGFDLRSLVPGANLLNDFICCLRGEDPEGYACLQAYLTSLCEIDPSICASGCGDASDSCSGLANSIKTACDGAVDSAHGVCMVYCFPPFDVCEQVCDYAQDQGLGACATAHGHAIDACLAAQSACLAGCSILDPYQDLHNAGWTAPLGIPCEDWVSLGAPWMDELADILLHPVDSFLAGYALLTDPPPAGLGGTPPPWISDAAELLSDMVNSPGELVDSLVDQFGTLDCSRIDPLAQQAVAACNIACGAIGGACYQTCDFVQGPCAITCHEDFDICVFGCDGVRIGCKVGCDSVRSTCVGVCNGARSVCNSGCDGARNACYAVCEAGPICGPVCQTCKAGCDATRTTCRNGCSATYNGCVGACDVTRNGCYLGCDGAYEACAFFGCPEDLDVCIDSVCSLECNNCLVDCGGLCNNIVPAANQLELACQSDWGALLRNALADQVIPIVAELLKTAMEIAVDVDTDAILGTLVTCPPEPVNLPDIALTLPSNPPLFINGDIVRRDDAENDDGELILANGTAGSIAFSGILEGNKVVVRSASPTFTYEGSRFTFAGRMIGGPIRNAKIGLLDPPFNLTPEFTAGNAEIRAHSIELTAAGGIGQITGFGDSGTAGGFLQDLITTIIPDFGGLRRLGTGIETGEAPLATIDGAAVPMYEGLHNALFPFTYLDGGDVPFIKITPFDTAAIALTAVNLETGGIFLTSDEALTLSAESTLLNSLGDLGFFNIGNVPMFHRSFKAAGSQAIELNVGGALNIHGKTINERGSITLSSPNSVLLGPGATLSAKEWIALDTPSMTQSATALIQVGVGQATVNDGQPALDVSGSLSLAGPLAITLPGGIHEEINDNSVIEMGVASAISGAFSNAPNGSRLATADHLGSFIIHYGAGSPFNADNIMLTDFQLNADADADGDVDNEDVADFAACLTGPAAPEGGKCDDSDLDGSGHVDLLDASVTQISFTGSQ